MAGSQRRSRMRGSVCGGASAACVLVADPPSTWPGPLCVVGSGSIAFFRCHAVLSRAQASIRSRVASSLAAERASSPPPSTQASTRRARERERERDSESTT
jgi:hypothetical protein